jgi:hypothetical protein
MKRKLLILVAVAFVGLLMVSPSVFATPFIGETIHFGDGPGLLGGGEFTMTGVTPYPNTFCVENGHPLEYLDFTSAFIVNAYEVPTNGAAYLYYHFLLGDLPGYAHNDTEATKLQQAIWAFQGQNNGDTTNSYYLLAAGASAADIALALEHVCILDMKYKYITQSYGANLTDELMNAQDVLAGRVPEPTTLLLLGLGLLGVGIVSRKK